MVGRGREWIRWHGRRLSQYLSVTDILTLVSRMRDLGCEGPINTLKEYGVDLDMDKRADYMLSAIDNRVKEAVVVSALEECTIDALELITSMIHYHSLEAFSVLIDFIRGSLNREEDPEKIKYYIDKAREVMIWCSIRPSDYLWLPLRLLRENLVEGALRLEAVKKEEE